jgi:PAS domain S-box-containing protein
LPILVELIKEAIILVDEHARVTYWNLAAEKMFGYTSQEALGKCIHDLVVPTSLCKEGKERIALSVNTFRRTGMGYFTVGNVELIGRRKDQSEFPIELSIAPRKVGRKWGAVATVKDITARKRTEHNLREAEQRYHALFNQSPLGVLIVNPENAEFLEFNDIAHKQLGYTREEFQRITLFDIEAKKSPEEIKQKIKKMLEEGGGEFETLHKTKTGENRNVLVNTRTFRSSGKTFLYGIFRDITESKKLEDDLSSSEERFRAISASAMDAIILSNADDIVVYWNPAAEKIFRYGEKEAVGKKLSTLVIPPHGREKHKFLLKQLREGDLTKKHFGFNALRKDGSMFPMDLAVVSVKLKDKECLLSIVRDITERKAMEDSLKQERDMLESMAASIDAGLAIISRDYRVLWVNQRLKQMGYSESIEGRHCYSAFTGDSKEICVDCGVKKIFENHQDVDRHDCFVKNGDRERWIEVIATPVKDKDDKVVAALELSIDITERKDLQNKLSEYSQRLEDLVQQRTRQLKKTQEELVRSERLAAIGELAGMIGHDLRNPLTGIKNSAYYLKKKGNSISQQQTQEMLETIDKCVDYSNKIINDLLDYSRDIHLELKTISLKNLLDDSLGLLSVPEKINILNMLSDESFVTIDADKIKRVFTNLVKNAVDAMPSGGEIKVIGNQVDDYIEVSFLDTGPGIPDSILPRLFSPLFTTKAQGMGFGLAICKRIIEAHDGTIAVRTVTGHGTTFTLTLPIELRTEVGGEVHG